MIEFLLPPDYLVAIPRWNVSSYVGSVSDGCVGMWVCDDIIMLLIGSLPQQVEVFAFPNSGAPLSGQNPPLGSSANTFFSNSIGVYDSLMNVTAYGTQVLHTFMDMQVGFRVLPLVKTNFELCLYISARACMIPFFFLSRNDPVSLPFQ